MSFPVNRLQGCVEIPYSTQPNLPRKLKKYVGKDISFSYTPRLAIRPIQISGFLDKVIVKTFGKGSKDHIFNTIILFLRTNERRNPEVKILVDGDINDLQLVKDADGLIHSIKTIRKYRSADFRYHVDN